VYYSAFIEYYSAFIVHYIVYYIVYYNEANLLITVN